MRKQVQRSQQTIVQRKTCVRIKAAQTPKKGRPFRFNLCAYFPTQTVHFRYNLHYAVKAQSKSGAATRLSGAVAGMLLETRQELDGITS